MKILCIGETLLRFATNKGERIHNLNFHTTIGGSETNIACSLSKFNMYTSLYTKLPNTPIGETVISFLKSKNVDTSHIDILPMRLGTYYLETGSGQRASSVIYDREHSAMTSFTYDDIKDFINDYDVIIFSGITAALSQQSQEALLKIAKNKQDKIIIYDNNYRAKMWSQDDAGTFFKQILPYVDILSAGYLDAYYFLNISSDKETYEEKLKDVYQQIHNIYPNIQYITSTQRIIHSSTVNDLTAYLYNGQFYKSSTYHIDDIIDRVGGGDAFISGIIYGLLNHESMQDTVEFGAAASVLKHTIIGDVNDFTVQEIKQYIQAGVGRIKR